MRLLKHLLKLTALLLVLVVTLAALAAAVISYQGRQRLAEVKAELTAKGEKLTLSELLPAPVPEHLNLFEDPIWRSVAQVNDASAKPRFQTPISKADTPLTDSEIAKGKILFGTPPFSELPPRTRIHVVNRAVDLQQPVSLTIQQANWILAILKDFNPLLDRLEVLLDRPFAKLDESSDILENVVYLYAGGLLTLSRALASRALASIALGRPEQSAEDICTLSQLITQTSPGAIFYIELMRQQIAAEILMVLRNGLENKIWSDDQLSAFE